MKVAVSERVAITDVATSSDTPVISYVTVIPALRERVFRIFDELSRLRELTVSVIALSANAVIPSFVLSVDLNVVWWAAVNVATVNPDIVILPLTTCAPVRAAKVGADVGFEPLYEQAPGSAQAKYSNLIALAQPAY